MNDAPIEFYFDFNSPYGYVCALINLRYPHVTVNPLDREILEIAITAMNLDGVGTHLFGHFGGKELGHRRFFQAFFATVS